MKRAYLYIMGRFHEVRADRALTAYFRLKDRAEKYFTRLGLRDDE